MSNTINKVEKSTTQEPRWDLGEFCDGFDDPKIERVIKETQEKAKGFEQDYKGKLAGLTSVQLKEAFDAMQEIMAPLYKLNQYSHLAYAVNTSGENEKTLVDRLDSASTDISNTLLFFTLELGAVKASIRDAWCSDSKLKKYIYNIEQIAKKAPFKLSEKEEQLINIKDLTGSDAFRKLYAELTASFEFEMTIDGKKQQLNGSQVRALRLHKDPKVRQEAMQTFFATYEANKLPIGHIFNGVIKDYVSEKKVRGYTHPMQAMNLYNDLPDSVIDLLHQKTNESYNLVQRYYGIKKKILKLPDFSLSDIYAPLPFAEKTISYVEAKEMVLEAFLGFSAEFSDIAKRMFDENRVDVPVIKGKRGGAFCSSSTPDMYPFVLLNYLGKSRDVSTLAHEFGHAIHAVFSAKQPLLNYHAILPLCETASVFCEMLLIDYRRQREIDPINKAVLLMDTLEDMFATSHRQNMFSNFEHAMHTEMKQGWVSQEKLCELYHTQLKTMFGETVVIPEYYKWEWSGVPHFLDVPFYVHSYNFGNLLVIALYQQFLDEGKASFYPKLKGLLEAGSSAAPKALCEAVGVDLESAAFWQGSFSYMGSLVDELDDLVSNHSLS